MSYVYLFMNMHRTFSLLSLFTVCDAKCLLGIFLFGVIVKYCFELSKSKKGSTDSPLGVGQGEPLEDERFGSFKPYHLQSRGVGMVPKSKQNCKAKP